MKAKYLNPAISALDEILNMTAQTEMTKKEAVGTQEIDSEKDYALYLAIQGDLNGFFSFHFDKEFAISIIDKLTGGMRNKEEIDEISKSGLAEVGGMVKSKIITELQDLGYNVTIDEVSFKEKNELDVKNSFIIKLTTSTDIGDIDIFVHLS